MLTLFYPLEVAIDSWGLLETTKGHIFQGSPIHIRPEAHAHLKYSQNCTKALKSPGKVPTELLYSSKFKGLATTLDAPLHQVKQQNPLYRAQKQRRKQGDGHTVCIVAREN